MEQHSSDVGRSCSNPLSAERPMIVVMLCSVPVIWSTGHQRRGGCCTHSGILRGCFSAVLQRSQGHPEAAVCKLL